MKLSSLVFVTLFSIFTSNIVLADDIKVVNFSGVWYGEGTLRSSRDDQIFQCDFTLRIKQTAEKFEFGKFTYACDGLAFTFTPPTLFIKNTKEVYWKDQLLGQLEPTKTKLVFHTDNGGTPTYTVELTNAQTMVYEDYQLFPDGWQLLNSTLKKISE